MNMKLNAKVESMLNGLRPNPAYNIKDRLFFSQVREDPQLEIDALSDVAGRKIVVVGSGGCTALSLASLGACVAAVDLNSAQNNLTELKYRALQHLSYEDALRFLGALPASGTFRFRMWSTLAAHVSPPCRDFWDERIRDIEKGVIGAGVTEKFIYFLMKFVTYAVHSPQKMDRLLASSTLQEQENFYTSEWNNKRWRLLFNLMLNKYAFTKAYSKEFFQYVENTSFSQLFFKLFEHGLTKLPVQENYFLNFMIKGSYSEDMLPLYLQSQHKALFQSEKAALSIHDASMQQYLGSCEDDSLDGVVLSNICEWMSRSDIEDLFKLAVRKIKPGGRFIFRNFVGFTVIPHALENSLVLLDSYSRELILKDRSLSQYRIAVCDVKK